MLFPDLGNALIPLTEDTPDNAGEWPANHTHGSILGCRGHLANHRAREGGKKKTLRCLLSLHVSRGACNEVWWRPYPTNLPPPPQHSPTPVHTYLICFFLNQGNFVTLVYAPPLQPQLWGTGLMWVCHITGTPGCSTPNIHNHHSLV